MSTSLVVRGRELYAASAFSECFSVLLRAEEQSPLDGPDLALLSESAFLIGREEDCIEISSRGYARMEALGDHRLAAQAAFWIAFLLFNRGEVARGSGWAARAKQLIDEHDLGGVEAGLLRGLEAHLLLETGEIEPAIATAREALAMGEKADAPDVMVLARLTIGWGLLTLGHPAESMTEFDEVMVAVSADETGPGVAGLAYCAVVAACMQLRDLRRAREWTSALTHWCEARPDLTPFRGDCLVHRSQILMLAGEWDSAVDTATDACQLLPGQRGGLAFYQLGEMHRLMGQFKAAEDDYRRANALGRQPEPGLSLLRLAQGRTDAAAATVRRLRAEERPPTDHADLLGACTEVMLGVADVAAARAAADELSSLADSLDAPMLSGSAAQCTGAVLLAEGNPRAALPVLRKSWQVWQELDLPHRAAQVRVLVGRCLQSLDDDDSALMEFDAARAVFTRLGAAPELAALESLTRGASAGGQLTARELQVIRLVASGRTNRAIAGELFLSEKTIARHLSNIYAKLDLSSRAAATAYAYDHGLVSRPA